MDGPSAINAHLPPAVSGWLETAPKLAGAWKNGDATAAATALGSMIEADPALHQAHCLSAFLSAARDDEDDAITHIDAALALAPGNPDYLKFKVDILSKSLIVARRRAAKADARLGQVTERLRAAEAARSWEDTQVKMLRTMRDYVTAKVPYSSLLSLSVGIDSGAKSEVIRVGNDEFGPLIERLKADDLSTFALLIEGLANAVEGRVYDSAAKFYGWIRQDSNFRSVDIQPVLTDEQVRNFDHRKADSQEFIGQEKSIRFNIARRSNLIERVREKISDGGEALRANTLVRVAVLNMRIHNVLSPGKDNKMSLVAEGMLLAAARYHGATGDPASILWLVDEAISMIGWGSGGRTVHLKAAKHALELLQRGEAVPKHLVKFVSDDDSHLKDYFCEEPFRRFDIIHGDTIAGDEATQEPRIYVCCTHWLPTTIGKLSDGPEKVLNSPIVQDIRRSILDGSYRYCDHVNCQKMASHSLPKRADVTDPALRTAMKENTTRVDAVREIVFAIDDTCNLSCPSCRTHVRTAPRPLEAKLISYVENTIYPLMKSADRILINPAGELFVSKPSRRILELAKNCPDLKIQIISNGTKFNPTEWAQFPGIHGKVEYVRVSLDAARRQTFEKLRRGASYDEVWKNLEFLSKLRKSREIEGLFLSFTYQLDNFREMPDFVELGERLGCDALLFERLMNMGAFSDDDYRARAVHMVDHPLHAEFKEILRNPLMRHAIVSGDIKGYSQELADNASRGDDADTSIVLFTDGASGDCWPLVEGLTAAPDAAQTPQERAHAALLTETPPEGRHRIEHKAIPLMRGPGVYKLACFVKPSGANHVMLEYRDNLTPNQNKPGRYGTSRFDLTEGVKLAESGNTLQSQIYPYGNGWFLLDIRMPYDSTHAVFNISLMSPDGDLIYPGAPNRALLVGGITMQFLGRHDAA